MTVAFRNGLYRSVVRASEKRFRGAVEQVERTLADSEPPRRSGHLHRSKRPARYRGLTGPVMSASVEYTAPQANFTDEGTRRHVIRPRRARALRFVVGGRVVFARRVNHPGTKATRWFRRNVTLTAWRRALRRP